MTKVDDSDGFHSTQFLNASCKDILGNPVILEYLKYAPSATAFSEFLQSCGWSEETCRKARHAKILLDRLGPVGFEPWTKTGNRPVKDQFLMIGPVCEGFPEGMAVYKMSEAFWIGDERDSRNGWPVLLRELALKSESGDLVTTFDGDGLGSFSCQPIDSNFNEIELPYSAESVATSPDDSRITIASTSGSGRLQIKMPRRNSRRLQINSKIAVMGPTGDKKFPEFYKLLEFTELGYSDDVTDSIRIFVRLDLKYKDGNLRDGDHISVGSLFFRRSYRISDSFSCELNIRYLIARNSFYLMLQNLKQGEAAIKFPFAPSRRHDIAFPDLKDELSIFDAKSKFSAAGQRAADDLWRLASAGQCWLTSIASSEVIAKPPNQLIDLLTPKERK
ncbi:MAG: hypothetical protein WC227_00845 [Patescibacteria group bacterium]|jgi:hypothetical protein